MVVRLLWTCVRCDGPIEQGQRLKLARPRGRQPNAGKPLGPRHEHCPRELMLAKQARTNAENTARQRARSAALGLSGARPAKWSGSCPACSQAIEKDQLILPSALPGRWEHERCPEQAAAD